MGTEGGDATAYPALGRRRRHAVHELAQISIACAALLVALGTFVYAVRSKSNESYVRQLERRIEELERQEKETAARIEVLERENHALLLRLVELGSRPQ